MTDTPRPNPPIAIDVPWAETLTDYDRAHFITYLRILDALADNASSDEIARIVLELDPERDPETARKAVDSHARRARWLTDHAYLILNSR